MVGTLQESYDSHRLLGFRGRVANQNPLVMSDKSEPTLASHFVVNHHKPRLKVEKIQFTRTPKQAWLLFAAKTSQACDGNSKALDASVEAFKGEMQPGPTTQCSRQLHRHASTYHDFCHEP